MSRRGRPAGAEHGRSARLAGLAALAMLALTALPAMAQSRADDERAIRSARERSNLAIARHDTAALAAEWMESFIVTTSNGAQQVGRAANVASFAAQFASRPDVVYRRTPDAITLYSPWGMAGETGRWEGGWTSNGERIRLGGTYFAKWMKRDGRWRLLAEIYMPEHCEGGAYCTTPPPSR